MVPVALTIAGSDPSGGAGVQADLKTFHQFGVYGTSALTLLTVQNTRCVSDLQIMAADLVRAQLHAVVSDFPVRAAKTGALGDVHVIRAVCEAANDFGFPLVVDPVMISKHGTPLLAKEAEHAMRANLVSFAALLTPNIPEAEVLTEHRIESRDDMKTAAKLLLQLGCRAVLLKGGHLKDSEPDDYLLTPEGEMWIRGKRVLTQHTHGTGCTYSAAITAGLARGDDLFTAVKNAKLFVQRAIETAPGLGTGCGPLNHWAN